MAGLNRMMRGRVLAERTGAVRGGKRRGSRKSPGLADWGRSTVGSAGARGKHRDCSAVSARGGAR